VSHGTTQGVAFCCLAAVGVPLLMAAITTRATLASRANSRRVTFPIVASTNDAGERRGTLPPLASRCGFDPGTSAITGRGPPGIARGSVVR
jgi:hypothetical protein